MVGSFKCNKPRCLVCVNVTETKFTCRITDKPYKINHKFDYDENCLLYLLTCKHCGIQYIGQTVADIRYSLFIIRITRKHSRNEYCMQKHLYDHYVSCNEDFPNTISVTFVDETDPSNPLERAVLRTYPTNQNISWSEYSRWCLFVLI